MNAGEGKKGFSTWNVVQTSLMCAGKKPVHIGCSDNQQEAALAYDQAAIRLQGEKTSLNFPVTDYDVSMTHDQGILMVLVMVLVMLRLKNVWLFYKPRYTCASSSGNGTNAWFLG